MEINDQSNDISRKGKAIVPNRKLRISNNTAQEELGIKVEPVEFELNEETFNDNSVNPNEYIDITTADNFENSKNDYDDDSQLSIPESIENSKNSQFHFEIVSVCSLNTNENSSSRDSSDTNAPIFNQQKTESTVGSKYSNVKAFGIAKSKNKNEKEETLLVPAKPKRHRRKKHEMELVREKSKLLKMKEKLSNFHQVRLQHLNEVTATATSSSLSAPSSLPSTSTGIRSTNRRKNIHKPIDDGAIEFMTDEKSSDQLQKERLEIVRSIKNPNADLMKNVAFLRVCVNYMLEEIGHKPHLFYHQTSLERLKAQYKRHYMK